MRRNLLRRRVRHIARAIARPFQTSVQFRLLVIAVSFSLISLLLLSLYLSIAMRDGLFERRLDEILGESARSLSQTQTTLNSSTATSTSQVQQTLNDLLPALQSGGTSGREVFLLRAQTNNSPVRVLDLSTAPAAEGLISPAIRDTVTNNPQQQHWQSVNIGPDNPGVIVGAIVDVPQAGAFEVYFLYSLASEQESLTFLQNTIAFAGAVLIGVLATLIYVVTRQIVRPVKQASVAAERIADGNLNERLIVRGQDEVATLARSFNAMTGSLQHQIDQLAQLSAVQRQFVSDVSHELRTPLTTVRMAAEILHESRDDFDPIVKRSTELLHTQLDRFEDLLADLLEISRFDAGAAMLDVEARDLSDTVVRVIDHELPLAEKKGVWISADLGTTSTRADYDSRRVERILRNLLVNAIEHAEGNPITITIGTSPEAVAVVVQDRGIGMDREAVTRVFDRFWRADPARARTTGGSGLGLSIAKEDARLHGGWLEAWGRPGFGSSFRLTLPRRAGIILTSSPIALEHKESLYEAPTPIPADDEHGPASVPRFDSKDDYPEDSDDD
ncbi:MtrAB system histidine kinase MtrB [Jonesia quinghaiensis]|uniref:MtrAB system histidine kinase MtrB n=1 Tax=Jonesia quinghaiensis TaxID=262806 RepID=UPI0012F9D629|nr:MtrAB system histidine kinase MtrB [Jonesia quinghaiensis]